jgi:hypothetical protein
MLRYRLRTLVILMALAPPAIAFWPHLQKRALARVATVNASDVTVVAAASAMIYLRVRCG